MPECSRCDKCVRTQKAYQHLSNSDYCASVCEIARRLSRVMSAAILKSCVSQLSEDSQCVVTTHTPRGRVWITARWLFVRIVNARSRRAKANASPDASEHLCIRAFFWTMHTHAGSVRLVSKQAGWHAYIQPAAEHADTQGKVGRKHDRAHTTL